MAHSARYKKLLLTTLGLAAGVVSLLAAKPFVLERILIHGLDSPDEAARRSAASRLAGMRSARAVPRLVELLVEVAPVVGHAVREAEPHVFVCGTPYVGDLAHLNCFDRDTYDTEAKTPFWEGLWPAHALVSIGAPSAAPLVEALSSRAFDARLAACRTLVRLGPAAVPALAAGLDEGLSPAERILVTLAVIGTDARPALSSVLRVLRSNDITERTYAAATVGLLEPGCEAALPALLEALDDPHPNVRAAAARSLGQGSFASEGTASRLTRMLFEESDEQARGQAANAAAKMGSFAPLTVPGLLSCLERDVPMDFSSTHAASALESLGPAAAGAVSGLIKLLSRSDLERRDAAARILGRIGVGAIQAVPALLKATEDSDVSLQAEAAIALWRVDGREDFSRIVLKRVLESPDARENARNRMSLESFVLEIAEMGPRALETAPVLETLLEDEDVGLRAVTGFALWRITGSVERSVPAIVSAIENKSVYARLQAARLLGLMGSAVRVRGVMALEQVLAAREEDELVHAAAAEALQRIRGASAHSGRRCE